MNISSFGPIEREGVAEKVVSLITDLIKAGNLKSGDRLPPERELIKLFQVSRPSLREALRALAIMGVIEIKHGGGIYVTELDAQSLLAPLEFYITLDEGNISDVFECRQSVEITIARKAALHITAEQIEKLHSLLATQQGQLQDPIGFRITDYEFHGIILQAAGNRLMERIAKSMHHMGIEYRRRACEIPGMIAKSCEDHAAILAGLEQHDQEATAAAMEAHLLHIERTTQQAIQLINDEKELEAERIQEKI